MSIDWLNVDDAVNHGSNSSIDDIAPVSFLWWYYIHTLETGKYLLQKDTDEPAVTMRTSLGVLQCVYDYGSGTNTSYVSGNGVLVAGAWQYLAVVFDRNAAKQARAWTGSLTAQASEITWSSQQNMTVGIAGSNAAANLIIGSQTDAGSRSPDWKVSHFSMYDVALTEEQIQAQQWRPWPMDKCVVFSHYSYLGAFSNDQPDWSGNANNGVPTAGMSYVDAAPIAVAA